VENAFDAIQFPYAALALITLGLLLWRPLIGLAVLTAIYPMDPYSPRLPVLGINTETFLCGLLFAVTVLRFGARLPPLRYSGPVIAFVSMNLVAFVLAVPWARGIEFNGGSAIWVIFKFWKSITFSSALFFATYWWVSRPGDRRLLLEALSIGVLVSCAAGLADYVLGITRTIEEGRASGLQGDPNAMAEAIGSMMFVPLYLAVFATDMARAKRVFYAGIYGLSFLLVVLSLSRGNWVALVVAHAVLLLFISRTLLFAGAVALLLTATIAFPILPKVIRDRITVTTQTGNSVYRVPAAVGLEQSTAERVVFTKIGMDMFQHSPLWGNGLNAFFFRTREFGAKYGVLEYKDPHNLAVKVAAEAGLIGLGTMAWLVWAVFRCGWRLWRADTAEYRLGAFLLASATHVLVASLSTDSFLYAKLISANFWILYALCARAYVERFASAAASSAAAATVPRWRRFSHSTAAAASQP
jgi:O-antigen ligase